MLMLYAGSFMGMLQTLFNSEMEVGRTRGPLPPIMAQTNASAIQAIGTFCDDLHLPVTRSSLEYLMVSTTSEELSAAYLHVKRNMHHELLGRTFIQPDPKYSEYFRNPILFGEQVFKAFSSATDDIFEAGTCLALERGTACVMHLMRVVEAALRVVASKIGVAEQKDWGAYLRNIDGELKRRYETAGARSADEQFYAEVADGFDRVRRAWRNPTMHVERSYSVDRAEEILLAVKSFISFLATRLAETQ
jgi:hypothetical protein